MKGCHKWMLVCLGILVVGWIVLPQIGINLSGLPVVAVLMMACCVLPMLLMAFSGNKEGGCCKKDSDSEVTSKNPQKGESSGKSAGGSCH